MQRFVLCFTIYNLIRTALLQIWTRKFSVAVVVCLHILLIGLYNGSTIEALFKGVGSGSFIPVFSRRSPAVTTLYYTQTAMYYLWMNIPVQWGDLILSK